MSRERIVQVLAVAMLVTSLFAVVSIGGYRTALEQPEPAAAGAEVQNSAGSGVVAANTPMPEQPSTATPANDVGDPETNSTAPTAPTAQPVLVGYTEKPMAVQRDGRTVTVPAGTPVYAYVGTGVNGTTTAAPTRDPTPTAAGGSGSSDGSGGSTAPSTPEPTPEEETGAS